MLVAFDRGLEIVKHAASWDAEIQLRGEEAAMSKMALGVFFAILRFAAATQAQETLTGCSPTELKNVLRPNDPAYADAIGLAGTLQKHGFTIECVLPSKFAQFLPRQTGATLFRTTMGDFEALFRPKKQNFDDIFISGERDANQPSSDDRGYRYIFRNAQVRMLQDIGGRETFFVRHNNLLLFTWLNKTAVSLTDALQDER